MDRPPSDSLRSDGRLPAHDLLLILAYGASLLMLNLGAPWALTFHEVNYAQPAREFLATGDWIVPRIVGVPLWDKPPLMHWLIALSMAVFGTEAEWATRLPTTLATLATAVLIAMLAARWHGRQIGRLAGLIQLTSVYVLIQGRLAEADMLLCATVTAAMSALAFGALDGPRTGSRARLFPLAYFGAAGLAFLAKGPLGLALVGGAGGLWAIIERRRQVWKFLLDPAGWILMLVLVIGWPALAMTSGQGLLDAWWQHNVERISGKLGGQKDPFFYFYTIPWLLLPWTPFLVLGLANGLKRRPSPERAAEARLLGAWVVAGLLLISISAWKHKHYAIPLLPPLSIVAACGLHRFRTQPRQWLLSSVRALALLLIVVGAVAWIVGAAAGASTIATAGALAALAGVGLAVSSTLDTSGRTREGLAVAFGTIWLLFIAAQASLMPRFDLYRAQAELAQRTSDRLPADAPLAVVEIPDPQITYYLRLPLSRFDHWDDFARRVAASSPSQRARYYVIGPRRLADELAQLGRVRVLDASSQVHPRKTEADRLMAFEFAPDPARLATLATPAGMKLK